MSLKEKLGRMRTHMQLDAMQDTAASATKTTAAASQETIGSGERTQSSTDLLWNAYGAVPYTVADLSILVREHCYPLAYQHGHYRLAQLHETVARWQNAEHDHPLSAKGLQSADLLFFDTETTGLQGGVGNAIFLLGTARVTADAVVLRQHFLPSPDAEAALYHSFARDLATSSHLVTYNGKSFDWPQVQTRHTLVRSQVPALPALGHFDLLHGARRLWKEDLESCRLSLIEPEKLGVTRSHDVPGHMAPILYFDYLHTRDPRAIYGVLQHNETDVLSLITLYIHLSTLLLGQSIENSCTTQEQFAIARWYEALGHEEQASVWYACVAASDHDLRGRAMLALGLIHKRRRNWRQASEVLAHCEQVMQPYTTPEVYVELAKLYEHHLKDDEKALHYAQLALATWQARARMVRHPSRVDRQAHERRIARLTERLSRIAPR